MKKVNSTTVNAIELFINNNNYNYDYNKDIKQKTKAFKDSESVRD